MTRVYYREAVGALVVFDVTRASTFDAVLKWKDDLDSKVRPHGGLGAPKIKPQPTAVQHVIRLSCSLSPFRLHRGISKPIPQ